MMARDSLATAALKNAVCVIQGNMAGISVRKKTFTKMGTFGKFPPAFHG